jgi:methionyl aminopeptidase
MAAETLLMVGEKLRPGMTTDEINTLVHEDTIRRGAMASPLNYHGFPKSVCTSVNDIVCHGIPSAQKLRPGDIINVDVTTLYNGYHGDTSATFYVGEPSAEARLVTEVARQSLEVGIARCGRRAHRGHRRGHPGVRREAGLLGGARLRGHGIGRKFHTEPQVPHYKPGRDAANPRMRSGMVFTIEPMINLGTWEVDVDLKDKWTVRTRDRRS